MISIKSMYFLFLLMKNERVVNIRFLFCVFIGLMVGIIVSYLFLVQAISIWVVFCLTLVVVSLGVVGFLYGKKTQEKNSLFRAKRHLSNVIKFSSIGFVIAFVLGVIFSIMPIIKIMLIKPYDEEVAITGIVSDYVDSEETYKKFILNECELVNNGSKNQLEYKILIYTNAQNNIELGDRVTFVSKLEKCEITDGFGFNSLINDIAYTTYINSSDMVVGDGNIGLKDSVHNEVYELLHNNLNDDNADICYAILFGQKEGLDEGLTQMFSYAGISHILAVSGLHISVLVSIIWFALRKVKCNKYIRLAIFASILLFYVYLCSFSPSVCRASIMALTLAICKTFMWEYDSLSSLSIAGIIILIVKPIMLFSISFQLSFMCIFSIITFAPCIEYVLRKIKCPKSLSKALAISIAVNVAILPIVINAFGKVSLLGVFSNLIVLPIFSIVYVLLFVMVLIGAIIKPLGVLLAIPNLFLHLIKVLANYVSEIPFGIYKVFNISYWVIALMIFVTLMIHYVISRSCWKFISILGLVCIIIMLFIFNALPSKYKGENLLIAKQYNSNIAISVNNDKVTMIGSNISCSKLIFIMKELRLRNIDNIVAYDLQVNEINELEKICEEFEVEYVYIPEKYKYESIKNKFNKVLIIDEEYEINQLSIKTICYNDDIIAVNVLCGESDILIPNLNNNKKETDFLIDNYSFVDYVIIDDNENWNSSGFVGVIHNVNSESIFIRG